MTRKPAGFTLVETVMALAIAGLVSMLAYSSLNVGLDTEQRVRRASAAADDDTRWRALASDAVRHMIEATQPDRPALIIGPDSMLFRTRALGAPSGAGSAWRVRVTIRDSAAVMHATNEETGAEIEARMPGVAALRVRAQSLGSPDRWQDAWIAPSPPVAVRFDFMVVSGAVLPLVVSVGLRP